jgi:4-diphosphocytidyl-2-C-methyl-D-erythritol kinase
MSLPSNYYLLLVTPNIPVSTAESYAAVNSVLTKGAATYSLQGCRTLPDLVDWLRLSRNDFEAMHVRRWPLLGLIREEIDRHKSLVTRLTGSGPTMFGIFAEPPPASAIRAMVESNWRVELVKPYVVEDV